MNRNKLIKCFNHAMINNYKYIGVKVFIIGLSKPEIVISQVDNFQERLEHYLGICDENLKIKDMSYLVKIIDCTYGDTFDKIEKDLIGER